MKLDRPKRQLDLFAFVALSHHPQKRKYTGEPYHIHLIAVAEMAEQYGLQYGYEIGLCHDLLEDTQITAYDLTEWLIKHYTNDEVDFIVTSVIELTDVYITEDYPNLNRLKRKNLECNRMADISENSQSIKYCDLIDNSKSITEHDKVFAEVYLREKQNLLSVMNKGDKHLFYKALNNLN